MKAVRLTDDLFLHAVSDMDKLSIEINTYAAPALMNEILEPFFARYGDRISLKTEISYVSVILLCFSALLMIIAGIVIRHAILSSIETDYVSLGILKAIGFTGKNIIASILLQYLIISLLGTVAAAVAGIFTSPAMAQVLMNSTGIFGSANLTPPIALSVILAILTVIGLIAYLTALRAAPAICVKVYVHFSYRRSDRHSAQPVY